MKSITEQTYDQIAPYFAEYHGRMSENVHQDLLEFLARIPKYGRVLDLGCGTGRDLSWLAQHPLRLSGADFSAGMLAETRKVVTCPLAQMDMRWLGLAERVFDGIWCNAALLHLPKSEAPRALDEMRRVLRENGLLDLAVQNGEGEALETNPYSGRGERFFARYSLAEITALLVENGFVVLKTSVFETPAAHLAALPGSGCGIIGENSPQENKYAFTVTHSPRRKRICQNRQTGRSSPRSSSEREGPAAGRRTG